MQSLSTFPETDRLAQFAEGLADVTDAMAMTYFRKPLEIEAKDDNSPVTQADRAIEAEMRRQITQAFPTLRHSGRGTGERATGVPAHLGHRPD